MTTLRYWTGTAPYIALAGALGYILGDKGPGWILVSIAVGVVGAFATIFVMGHNKKEK